MDWTPVATITGLPRPAACRAAIAAANRPSATPIPNPPTAFSVELASVVIRSAMAASPPKYRDGPFAKNESIPGSVISTRGINAAIAVTTPSNRRASPSGSCATRRRCGQQACAWRRRCPTTMPSRPAANEWAITRLPCSTATCSPGAACAATTAAQFGHHNTPSRNELTPGQYRTCVRDFKDNYAN